MRTVLRENGTHTVVSVNGEQVRGVSDLRDGDVVAFGVTQMFKVCQVSPGDADAANDQDDEDEEEMWSDTDSEDGAAKDKKKAINQQQDRRMLHYSQKKQQRPLSLKRYAVDTDLTAYEHACRQAMLPSLIDSWRHVMSDTLHQEHMGVDRPMVAIAKTADKPKVPSSYTPSRNSYDPFVPQSQRGSASPRDTSSRWTRRRFIRRRVEKYNAALSEQIFSRENTLRRLARST